MTEVQFVRPDNLETAEIEGVPFIVHIIGLRGRLSPSEAYKSAALWHRRQALPQYAKLPCLISISGFDDDPRELWNIAEARRYIRRWAKLAKLDSMAAVLKSRLLPQSRGLLGACGAIKDLHPDTVKIVSKDEDDAATIEEIKYRVL